MKEDVIDRQEEKDVLREYKGKWAAMYSDKGIMHIGRRRYNSEEEVLLAHEKWEKYTLDNYGRNRKFRLTEGDGESKTILAESICLNEITFMGAIPVKD